MKIGDREAAEASLRRAIELDVSYWASFNAMGNFLYGEGRYEDAAEFYEMFVNRSDEDALAINNLGAAYYLAGDFRRAAEAWDRSLAIRPTLEAYSNTGSMYFYIGEYEKAIDRYTLAVNLAPMDYRLWGNLADAYYYVDALKPASNISYRRAIELAEQRLAINASDFDTVSDVAYYYARIGEFDIAMEMNARSLSAAPDNMYVQYNSALINAAAGRPSEAIEAAERAVHLNYQPELLAIDPGLKPLSDLPAFRGLVATTSNQ